MSITFKDLQDQTKASSKVQRSVKFLKQGRRFLDDVKAIAPETEDFVKVVKGYCVAPKLLKGRVDVFLSLFQKQKLIISPMRNEGIFFSFDSAIDLSEEATRLHTAATAGRQKEHLDGYLLSSVCVVYDLGTIILWGVSAVNEEVILMNLIKVLKGTLKLDQVSYDEYPFEYVSESSFGIDPIYQNRLLIPMENFEPFSSSHKERNDLMKQSISYALSASLKLDLIESKVTRVVSEVRYLPAELAATGKIVSVGQNQVARKIGEVFLYKTSLNLIYRLVNVPQFVSLLDEEYQMAYREFRIFVDLEHRTKIVNYRMEVLTNILGAFESEKGHKHESLLVWIIIMLIVLDAIVMGLQVGMRLV